MMEQTKRILQRWERAIRRLHRPPNVPQGFEGAVQGALRPVEPSPTFREGLRGNLSLAAQHKVSGLVVEYPKPFREGIILGLFTGLLAAAVAALLLVIRSRPAGARR
jgi:hypothetical protein